jgi:tRNA-Thr(GGU) m(6)t(6)A37 methyltransferase TsaA
MDKQEKDNIPDGHEAHPPVVLTPIGFIRNSTTEPFLVAGSDGLKMQGESRHNLDRVRRSAGSVSEIVIAGEFAGCLEGIEEYSHITVLYWAHKVSAEGRSLRCVHPMGRPDIPAVGIFSTCSPARPNPVLVTVVELLKRTGNVLEVAGIDAVDGSPVIDIKPYVREQFPKEGLRIPAWMAQLMEEVGRS